LLPADVTGLASGVSAITTGTTHACAVSTDGTSKCWGRNLHGELGQITATFTTPQTVPGIHD
jgi:alpha-tubulin suppressor-like RCC1 family protein